MKFDCYTDYSTICNRYGYFDKRCKNFVSLCASYGFPTSMCKWNRIFCIGLSCDLFDSLFCDHLVVQLEIPFAYA